RNVVASPAAPAASRAAALKVIVVMNQPLTTRSLQATAAAETVPAATVRPAAIATAAPTVASIHALGTAARAACSDNTVARSPPHSATPRRDRRARSNSRAFATRPRTIPTVHPR